MDDFIQIINKNHDILKHINKNRKLINCPPLELMDEYNSYPTLSFAGLSDDESYYGKQYGATIHYNNAVIANNTTQATLAFLKLKP